MFGTSFNSHFVIELSLALVLVGAILTGHSQNLVSYRYEKLGLNKHRLSKNIYERYHRFLLILLTLFGNTVV